MGAAARELSQWTAELKPVAVLAFGRGRSDAFTIEGRASRQRGHEADNLGERPARSEIVADGPREYRASVDVNKFARLLKAHGYSLRVSNNAGGFLCEEALYSLEHLKANRQLRGTVAFFHVPPLGAKLHGQVVTAAYVQKFVVDAVDTSAQHLRRTAARYGCAVYRAAARHADCHARRAAGRAGREGLHRHLLPQLVDPGHGYLRRLLPARGVDPIH